MAYAGSYAGFGARPRRAGQRSNARDVNASTGCSCHCPDFAAGGRRPGGRGRCCAEGPGRRAALVRGDAGQAVAGYTDALKDPALPNDRRATILNDRAVAYARLGQTKLAIDDFNRAAQLFPEYAAIYNNRGNLLLAARLPRGGDQGLQPRHRAGAGLCGSAVEPRRRLRQGRSQRPGHPRLHAGVRLMPQSAAPLAGRGRVHAAAGRPTPPSAISPARSPPIRALPPPTAVAPKPSSTSMRLPDAIEDLSRAIAFDANNAELYLLRGQAYLASDNVAAAMKDFTQATTLDPALGARLRGARARQRHRADLRGGIRRPQSRHRTRPALGARLRLPRSRLQDERADRRWRQGCRDGREARSRRRRGAVGQGRDRRGARAAPSRRSPTTRRPSLCSRG